MWSTSRRATKVARAIATDAMPAAGATVAVAAAAAVDVRVGAAGAGFGPAVAVVRAFARARAGVLAVPAVQAIEIEVPPGRRRRPAKAGW